MSHFVRASKYRHVYGESAKLEKSYTNIRLSTATGEQNYIKGNTKFFAVSIQAGGGAMAVVPYEKYGKFDPDFPLITGHKGAILDFDFNPFHEHIIASGSDDTSIKIWGIPEGGLTESCTEPLVDLQGHQRKVTLLKFHPIANNILGSISADFSIKLWDIENGTDIVNFEMDSENLIQDLEWNYNGNLLSTSCKDKILRIYDARTGEISLTKENAHEGSKSVKLAFLGNKDRLVSVGFTRQSQRQFKIWDLRKMDDELKKIDIDQAAGVIMPFYDPDTNLLYLCGKGDGNIRYYEMIENATTEPYAFPISEYRSTTAARGMAMIPKRALDIMNCETARLLKLTNNAVEPLHFFIPRKSDAFQDDIYPDTAAGCYTLTSQEWLSGQEGDPALCSLKPQDNKKITYNGRKNTTRTSTKKKSISGISTKSSRINRITRSGTSPGKSLSARTFVRSFLPNRSNKNENDNNTTNDNDKNTNSLNDTNDSNEDMDLEMELQYAKNRIKELEDLLRKNNIHF